MSTAESETRSQAGSKLEPILHEVPLDRDEQSAVFWRQPRPGLAKAIERHNQRIGTWHQRAISQFLWVYLIGFFAWVALRLLVRVRVEGREHIRGRKKAVLAMRHFFEWDPPVGYWMLLFPRVLATPYQHPVSLAGHYWSKTRGRRLLSYLCKVMGFIRGDGPRQGAMQRAVDLLRDRPRCYIAIFPTGPIGKKKNYEVRPGVGHLACMQPDVPVLPVSVVGIQELRWRDIVRLRRPELVYRIGEPIAAKDVRAEDEEARAERICEHVARVWARDEASIREALRRGSADDRTAGAAAKNR